MGNLWKGVDGVRGWWQQPKVGQRVSNIYALQHIYWPIQNVHIMEMVYIVLTHPQLTISILFCLLIFG